MVISSAWSDANAVTLFCGDWRRLIRDIPNDTVDLVLTSPPYCIGKAYEHKRKPEDFMKEHQEILPEIVRIAKNGSNICWQVGYHVTAGVTVPLDFIVYEILSKFPEIKLRNRIIWTFGHGLHSSDRFSGRHETLLWFSKGHVGCFNLDSVRVPQKYPGKRHYKGSKKGEFSGNPMGKNPSDVWDIPNVKANHIEKTSHPCQFPIALAMRVIKGLSSKESIVFDPFAGSGTTGAASVLLRRRFIGAEINRKYYKMAESRILAAAASKLEYRPDGIPVYQPSPQTPLTRVPAGWFKHRSREVSS